MRTPLGKYQMIRDPQPQKFLTPNLCYYKTPPQMSSRLSPIMSMHWTHGEFQVQNWMNVFCSYVQDLVSVVVFWGSHDLDMIVMTADICQTVGYTWDLKAGRPFFLTTNMKKNGKTDRNGSRLWTLKTHLHWFKIFYFSLQSP